MNYTTPNTLTREECRRRLAANMPRILEERQTNVGRLAEAAGVCRRVLHRAILGQTDPAVSLLASVARTLNVPMEEMLRPLPPAKKKTRKPS